MSDHYSKTKTDIYDLALANAVSEAQALLPITLFYRHHQNLTRTALNFAYGSVFNFMVKMVAGLIAYSYREKKPLLNLHPSDLA